MFPIIKIRLTYIKRNLIKSLFSFGYPVIMIYLFSIILNNSEKFELYPASTTSSNKVNTQKVLNTKTVKSNEPKKYSSKYFNLFNKQEIELIQNGDVGIISDNEDILNKFKLFSLENFCLNVEQLDMLNSEIQSILKEMNINGLDKTKIPFLNSINCKVKTFKSKKDFNNYIFSEEYKNASEFTVVFELKKENDILNINILSKEIKINSVEKSKNLLLVDSLGGQEDMIKSVLNPTNSDESYKNYYLILSNFLKLYYNYYSDTKKINDTEKINIYYKPLNSVPLTNKFSNEITLMFIPMLLSISFSSTLFSFVLWMVKEKSQNLHQFLFRYGITPNKYYRSWFITFLILTVLPIIFCTYFIHKYAFVNINIHLIFFSLMIFDISLFSTSMLMHCLTKTIEQSQTLLKLVYIFLTFLSSMITKPEVSYFMKKIFAFFPQILLMQNFQQLILLDNYKKLDFDLWKIPYNKISLLDTYTSYFIVIFLHLFLSNFIMSYQNFYFGENDENKTEKNFIKFIKYFFSIKNLFNCNFGYINLTELESEPELAKNEIQIEMPTKVNENESDDNNIDNDNNETKNDDFDLSNNVDIKEYHEKLNEHQFQYLISKKCLTIHNISKSYADVLAVNNFKSNLFPSEIFCLLGHNGAGKTTLIKIISGIENPDKGDIYLFGNSILKNKDILYHSIGVCNQENIFFDYLTVYEHLKYLTEIKQNCYFLSQDSITEINNLITKLNLDEKKNSLSETLSGGQKRKFCIALALAGNSKLILLDEPTSGMDVLAKREVWNFFKNYKHDKIIILTTHSLEEAEYLGDRIGIMLDGKFICSGTGSFLKNKYPCGYNINFLLKNNINNRRDLLDELKEIDNTATIKVSSKNLISINFMSMNDRKINLIFEKIEKNFFITKYGIINYTISTTSLEDVFLKLNNDEMSKIMFNNTKLFKKPHNELSENLINSTQTASNASDSINVMIQESNLNSNNNINNNININALNNININASVNCARKIKFTLNELKEGIKRNFIPLWRNKCNFIIEVFSASITIIIYLLGINSLFSFSNYNSKNIELMKVYDGLPIYFTSNFDANDKNNFFNIYNKDNIIQKKYPFLKIKEIDYPTNLETYNINSFADYFYNISKYKTEKNFLILKKNEKNEIDIYILYHKVTRDYFPASMNFILSILFQQKYDIKTYFISEVNKIQLGSKPDELKTLEQLMMLFYSIIMLWNSFISLAGYMINTPLKERIKNIKHLLKLSGANIFIYWLSILIVDMIKYLIFICTVLPLLIYLDRVYLYNLIMLIPFLLALNMFVYAFSFITDSEIHCQKFFILTVYIISFALPFYSILRNPQGIQGFFIDDQFFYSISDLFPFSSIIIAMFRLFYNSSIQKYNFFFGNKKMGFIIYNHCVIFLIQFIFYLVLLILFEKKIPERIYIYFSNLLCFNRIYSEQIETNNRPNALNHNNINNNIYSRLNEDSNNNINNINSSNNNINENNNNNNINFTTKIKNLYKTYFVCRGKNVRAVNNLNLNLEKNEHFGLIGYNGSGKTTTFKSITREIFFDKGSIELFGLNVSKSSDFSKLTKEIGYCPQENALFDYLTVEEVLNFFKNLKREGNNIDINIIYEKFGLSKYKYKRTVNLSGGNKRKLNFAIALMNDPKIILLDEPSTGVDPESRRLMWINLLSLKREYNMILSTHSMEEAEILSDRVGWMKEGKFTVEGIPEELKIKFSSGYYLFIKFIPIKKLKEEFNETNMNIQDIKDKFNKIINNQEDMNILIGNYEQNNSSNIINNPNDENNNKIKLEDNCLVLMKVYKVFEEIKNKYKDIKIIERDIDNNTFKFLVHVEQNNQGELFKTVLNIKNNMKEVSEININIESLENIFTKFQ